MTYVVCEPCVNCRYTDCVVVCPVEAFHLDDTAVWINPETCIDCDACVPECPVEAIFAEDKVPEQWTEYTAINAEFSTKWPNINKQKEGLPDADKYKEMEGKRGMLKLEPPT